MVPLQEDRSLPALADRRGQDHGGVFRGALLCVADLAARDLEDQRSGVQRLRGPEGRARGVVGEHADVDSGHGEARDLTAAPRAVERQDRSGKDAERRGRLPDRHPRLLARLLRAEDGRPDEAFDHALAKARRVRDAQTAIRRDRLRAVEEVVHFAGGVEEVHAASPTGGDSSRRRET